MSRKITEIFVMTLKNPEQADAVRERARADFLSLDGVDSWRTYTTIDPEKPVLFAEVYEFPDEESARRVTPQFATRVATSAFLAEVDELAGRAIFCRAPTKRKLKMNDIDNIKAAIHEWNSGLDSGDLDRMLRTCDPDAITCNEGQPTTVGSQAIRDKYAPRIAAADIKSGYKIEQIKVHGDMGLVVGHFTGEMTDKVSGEVRRAEGRLILGYSRHDDGSWKMVLDVDNNA